MRTISVRLDDASEARLDNLCQILSTWPVTTEVCRLIPADVAPRFLAWVSLGGLNLAELGGSALEWMATWMRQYGDLTNALACLEPDALRKKGRVPTNAMCSSPSSRPS